MSVLIYHNPRCSKSRQALELLRNRGIEAEVILYLEDPPDAFELDQLLVKLGLEPRELMRKKESVYAEKGLDDRSLTRDHLIQAMVHNPILIERPIVVTGDRACVGRPPENILEII